MTPVTAIGYVRVSTQEQTEGFGLEIQREAIEAYCKANGLTLAAVHADEGISGSNGLDSRDGLAEALASIEAGSASVLVVYRYDRLARKLALQETIIDQLAGVGARVVSVSEPDVPGDDELRNLIRQVLGAVAEYERAVIRGRMAGGRRRKAAAGGYIGGFVRFGFDVRDGEYAENPAEQATIARARELREMGLSLRQIAASLEFEGHRTKHGGTWQATQVKRLLV